MKTHRQDKNRAVILSQESGVNDMMAWANARIVFLDALAHESKETGLQFTVSLWRKDRPLAERVQEAMMLTSTKYDGERVWGGSGVTRAELELHEEFFHRGTVGALPATTVREVRERLRDEVLRLAAAAPAEGGA